MPCGQTDRKTGRYDEANGSFSQYCERANKRFAWFGEGSEPNARPDRTGPWHSVHEDEARFVTASRKESF